MAVQSRPTVAVAPNRVTRGTHWWVDRRLLKVGSVAAIVGQILLLVSSAFHPSQEHPADHPAVFREYAESSSWITVHLVQWVGGVLMFVALAFLALHIIRSAQRGNMVARIGLGASITVAAIFTVLHAVDGVSLKMAVDRWAEASPPNRAAAFSAAEAIRWTEIGLNALARVLQGVAVIAVSVAAVAARFHGRTLAMLGLAAGLGGVAGGLGTSYTGFSTLVAAISMGPMFLQIFWLIGTAVAMWRRAGVLPPLVESA
jgi:hypothetical protein